MESNAYLAVLPEVRKSVRGLLPGIISFIFFLLKDMSRVVVEYDMHVFIIKLMPNFVVYAYFVTAATRSFFCVLSRMCLVHSHNILMDTLFYTGFFLLYC